jgi:oxaloacetate decarboxylase beta subunit
LVSFVFSQIAGLVPAKFMNLFIKDEIDSLIGEAGVSTVPMAARLVHILARQEDKHTFILMQATGQNVAGASGTATNT